MAVVDLTATNILNHSATKRTRYKSRPVSAANPGKTITALLTTVAVGSTNSNTSDYRMFTGIPATAIPLVLKLGCGANTGATSYDLGIYANASTVMANAQTIFGSALDLHLAKTLLGASGIDGLSTFKTGQRNVAMQTAAVATGNGTALQFTGCDTVDLDVTANVLTTGGMSLTFETAPDNSTWTAVTNPDWKW